MEEKISSAVKIRSAETEIDHFRLCRLSAPMNHRTKDAYPISPTLTLTNDFKFLSNCWQTGFCIIWFIMPLSPWVSHLSLEKKTILPQKLVSLDVSLSGGRSRNITCKWLSSLPDHLVFKCHHFFSLLNHLFAICGDLPLENCDRIVWEGFRCGQTEISRPRLI